MNKIKMLAASVLFVFAIGSVNMIACDKSKAATKTSCNTEAKASSCETVNVKKVATKEAKGDCSTKCMDTKTASVKNAKASCCSSAKETKLEATKVSNDVKTVAETPSK